MNIFERIAIGTANWGRAYNGVKVPDKDIEKILGYCQCSGIDTLDCATAYGWDWTQANSYFNKIVKIQSIDELEKVVKTEPYCVMAHNEDDWELAEQISKSRDNYIEKGIFYNPGISLYTSQHIDVYKNELRTFFRYGCGLSLSHVWEKLIDSYTPLIVQLPYNLYDRRFSELMNRINNLGGAVHVRSIFLRGKIIEDGIPAEECIKFVLANPYIDKIIIGADSFDQLRRNLDFVFKWNNLEKHDEKLLDPRKWSENGK